MDPPSQRAAPPPTTTFLFTDIEGSTRRWEQQRAAMSAALARHDAILRVACTSAGGLVFKTVGDAFCVAFARAGDALTAALAAQRALATEDWGAFGPDFTNLRVRMAIHTGEAEERDGDFFGPTVNRVARLLAIGHGGQILLSRAAHELLADTLAADLGLIDLGEHRLKDLTRPERVYQVIASGLDRDFPPLRSLDRRSNNLPIQLTSFVGREADITRLRATLAEERLVTLTGIGGTGKTRLALQVAADLVEDYPDGVWFVDLAPLADPGLVPQAVAVALGLREEPGRPLVHTLLDYLADRQALLVLDNCEHLVSAAAQLAATVLGAAPGVRILATSRELLGVPGEHALAVAPLPVPPVSEPGAGPLDVGGLNRFATVQLFVQRAAAARADFRVTADNAPAIVTICQRLDGLPLAIELAAARVRHLDPAAILAHLDDRFRLLTGGSRVAASRQQTLQAALDWSHDLLDPPERVLFRRLAIFRGGWTLDAAEAVCADPQQVAGGELASYDVLETMGHLVDKSLVVVRETAEGRVRYTYLETVRHYADQRLHESGEGTDLAAHHLAYFEALSAETERHRNTRASGEWLERLDAEVDNVRAALDRVILDALSPEVGFRLGGRLWWLWATRRASKDELLARLEALLARHEAAVSDEALVTVLYSAGTAAGHLQRLDDSQRHKERALDLARASGLVQLQAWCLNDLGNLARSRGDYGLADRHLRASLTLKEQVGNPWDVAVGLHNLGLVAFAAGDMAAAITWQTQSAELAQRTGSAGLQSGALADLAHALALEGRLAEGRQAVDDACWLAEASGELIRQADAFESAGLVAFLEGRLDEARAAWARALRHALALGQRRHELLGYAARLAAALGDGLAAARLAGAFSVGRPRAQNPDLPPAERAAIQADLDRARAATRGEAWDLAFAAGQALEPVDAQTMALDWLTGVSAEPSG